MSEPTENPIIRPILLIGSGISELVVNQILVKMDRQECEVRQSMVLEHDQVVLIDEAARRAFLPQEAPPLSVLDYREFETARLDPPKFNGYMGRRRKR